MMDGSDNSKDWPTLNDSNGACASANKNKHHSNSKDRPKSKESSKVCRTNEKKDSSNVKTDVTDGAHGLADESTSTNSKTGARKKQSGKTKWSRVQIDLPSYRENRNERHYNESRRFHNGRRYNNHESAHNFTNGHESAKGRAFRGGRGGRGQFRNRRENTTNSDPPSCQDLSRNYFFQLFRHMQTAQFTESRKKQIRLQVEFYLSEKNLVTDTFLRSKMDEQGYITIELLATFPRIVRLAFFNYKEIIDALKSSNRLEVSEDAKVRPVVDPLRWPLPTMHNASVINTSQPELCVELIATQFNNMSIDPAYRHIPLLEPCLPWQFIPVNNSDGSETFFCVDYVDYPHVDSNGIDAAAASSKIPNGSSSSSEHLISPNSDLHCEFPSQFLPNDYEIENGTVVCLVPETQVVPNGIGDIGSDSNFPIGQVCASGKDLLPSNGEFSSHDLHSEAEESFHPVNGSCLNGDSDNYAPTCASNVLNGLECSSENYAVCASNVLNERECSSENYVSVCASNVLNGHECSSDNYASACASNVLNGLECSSDFRHVSEIGAYNCYYGPLPNGVIMYSSGGEYYVTHSTEILASGTDSSDEKSSHNKSPEPPR